MACPNVNPRNTLGWAAPWRCGMAIHIMYTPPQQQPAVACLFLLAFAASTADVAAPTYGVHVGWSKRVHQERKLRADCPFRKNASEALIQGHSEHWNGTRAMNEHPFWTTFCQPFRFPLGAVDLINYFHYTSIACLVKIIMQPGSSLGIFPLLIHFSPSRAHFFTLTGKRRLEISLS